MQKKSIRRSLRSRERTHEQLVRAVKVQVLAPDCEASEVLALENYGKAHSFVLKHFVRLLR